MKIDKIHVYIKNQKQTDELPKSQVGFGLGEVCNVVLTGSRSHCVPIGVAGSAIVKSYIYTILLVPKLPRVIHFTMVNVNSFNSVGLI